MAYGRTRRRRYNRKKRTLSSYNIATKTGAKAQSRQIYALKRRVNWIQRLTKPEVRVQNQALTLYSQGTNPITFAVGSGYGLLQFGSTTFSYPQGILGDFARLNSFTLSGSLQYSSLTTLSTP